MSHETWQLVTCLKMSSSIIWQIWHIDVEIVELNILADQVSHEKFFALNGFFCRSYLVWKIKHVGASCSSSDDSAWTCEMANWFLWCNFANYPDMNWKHEHEDQDLQGVPQNMAVVKIFEGRVLYLKWFTTFIHTPYFRSTILSS